MSDDIETKRFTRERVEYWIPTGTYHADGARIEDINLAIAWAKQELEKRGVVMQRSAVPLTSFDFEGHIRIKPHDEHVIIYIEFDEEQKK